MSGTTPLVLGPVDERQLSSITGSGPQITAVQNSVAALQLQANALAVLTTNLQAQIQQIPPPINAALLVLTNSVNSINTSLTTVNTNITSLQTQMAAVQTAATALANRVTVLETAVPPPAVPDAPTALVVGTITDTTIGYSWTAPASGPAVTSYQLQSSPAGQGVWTNQTAGAGTTGTSSGLTALTAYDARVIASDAAGPGGILTSSSSSTTLATAGVVTWGSLSTGIVLSNANFTATATGGSATPYSLVQDTQSTTSKSTGKWCFEVTLTQLTQNTAIGLINASHTLGTTGGFGVDTNSIGYYLSTGTGSGPPQAIYYNSTVLLNPPSPGPASDIAGATSTWCVDFDNDLLWVTSPAMRTFFGPFAWNNSATAVPGVSGGIASSVAGAKFIAVDTSESGMVATGNFGTATFSYCPPVAFSPWNGASLSIVTPGTPTALSAGTPGSTSVPLSWTAAATGTPPFTYEIQHSLHGLNTWSGSDTASVTSGSSTGLAANTSYDFRVRSTNQNGNSAYVTLSTGITTVATSTGPGPAASGSFINADFTSLSGKLVVRELFGGSSATIPDFDWQLCNDTAFAVQSKLMDPPLIRINCNSGGSGTVGTWPRVFALPNSTPDWTGPNKFIANAHNMFNLSTTRIIMGIGGPSQTGNDGDTMGATPTQFASICSQIATHFATTPGGDGNIVSLYGFEIMNEWDGRLTPAQYLTYFTPAAQALHAVNPAYKIYGPTTANNGTDVNAFVTLANGTDFNGSCDDHAYSKCPQDPSPSDVQVVQALHGGAGTIPDLWAQDRAVNILQSHAYSANYRIFCGEYNIDCSAGDSRQIDWRGALFACSWVNKLVDGASAQNVVEAGIWEYGTAGNFYGQFVGNPGSWTPTPQAQYLSKATKVCPGSRCNVTKPGAASMLCWATVNGAHFSLTIVNPGATASGQIALSHWPVNSTGSSTINVWTQSQAIPNGSVSQVVVNSGITNSVTIPSLGQVILYL